MAEPKTTCGACGQTDDHPKHQVIVGFNNEHTDGMFHDHDFGREGQVFYHFDCPSVWHSTLPDPEVQAHHDRIRALAASGVHGAKLRERIVNGDV